MNKKEPYIAHSDLTGAIYVIVGNDKYNVTEQAKKAVKAVEHEPCGDCVSRKAVLDLVNSDWKYEGLEEPIEDLPSVTPKKDEWIPCDIRLPKQNEYIGNVCKYYLVQDKYDDMYVARYTERGWNPIDTLFFLDEVVAWRPLPERYEYEGDNND